MSHWQYQILQLSAEEKHERRTLLDQYGAYAFASTVAVICAPRLLRVARWALKLLEIRRVDYDVVPDADSDAPQQRYSATLTRLLQKARYIIWWLGDEVIIAGHALGRRDEWLFGGLWTTWLLFLCVHRTGHDYQHLTKRFGAVAASQLPVQYGLAAKRLNPVAYAAPEHVNRWHRVLGAVVYLLFVTHGVLYLNFYVQVGGLGHAFLRRVPVLGMLGLSLMTLLSSTALRLVRRWSYRVFYITHALVASALPVTIWFHARHARVYMVIALGAFCVDVLIRRWYRLRTTAVATVVPGTDLVSIVARASGTGVEEFGKVPASYAYLSVPRRRWWRPSLTANPFTVASAGTTEAEGVGELRFVARLRAGPLSRKLGGLAAALESSAGSTTGAKLDVDGPYGAARHFPDLSSPEFDQVLLVAGGVGGTFILPLYEHIVASNPVAGVKMVWAVRHLDEMAWPFLATSGTLRQDERVHLYVTGGVLGERSSPGGTELEKGCELNGLEKANHGEIQAAVEQYRRPDLHTIVGDAFKAASRGRVAVVVCGPVQMTRDTRNAIGLWLKKGKRVWFHSERFDS